MLAAGTTARANVNVALVKYWGKRDPELNLPATGSISLTLEGLSVEARVAFGEHATDRIEIDGGPARGEEAARVTHFLDVLRREAGRHERADAFAALALARSRAAGLRLEPPALSTLARRGSGSAARSIFGGFVEWRRGERKDGRDSVASSLATTDGWDIRVVIAVTASAPKVVSSRAGMTRALSSPLYPAWVASVEADLDEARAAIRARDFEALGLLAEHSALKMHAIGLAARPALLYWRGATIECMHRVWALRAEGTAAFFTIDAGPQVKVLCQTAAADRVVEVLRDTPGVERILTCAPGGGAEVLA